MTIRGCVPILTFHIFYIRKYIDSNGLYNYRARKMLYELDWI
jgi:hypothetical protein